MEYYIKEHGIIYQKTPNAIKHLDCNECAYGKKHIGGIYCSLFQASKCENGYHYKIKENNMKKSELSFKCVLPTPKHANTITERLEAIGVYNIEVVKSRLAESGKTAKFLSLDNKMGFVFGLSDNASFFCNWTEPLMSYEDALKLIESIEPDAPEFDIKPFYRVLLRDMNGEWSADFYNKIYGASEFDFVASQANQMIKYEGNEKYHGTKDAPDGWWECENWKPVWRTK